MIRKHKNSQQCHGIVVQKKLMEKNTHFCDMLQLAKARGITPSAVVMDAWYDVVQ
jgi:hypothetical protein